MSEKEWQLSEADRDNLFLRDDDEAFSGLRQALMEEQAANQVLRAEIKRLKVICKDKSDLLDVWRAEIERLRAENAEQKAEMQKLYDNWVRVLHGKEGK